MFTEMTDDELMAEAVNLLRSLHEYELVCLHGSSSREREHGRAAKDRLIEVCTEVGVRHLSERFKDMIAEHKAAYAANLKELENGDEKGEGETARGRLSWWNL